MINISFEHETEYGTYRDSIILPDDHSCTSAEINEIGMARMDEWLLSITDPPATEETVEEVTENG